MMARPSDPTYVSVRIRTNHNNTFDKVCIFSGLLTCQSMYIVYESWNTVVCSVLPCSSQGRDGCLSGCLRFTARLSCMNLVIVIYIP